MTKRIILILVGTIVFLTLTIIINLRAASDPCYLGTRSFGSPCGDAFLFSPLQTFARPITIIAALFVLFTFIRNKKLLLTIFIGYVIYIGYRVYDDSLNTIGGQCATKHFNEFNWCTVNAYNIESGAFMGAVPLLIFAAVLKITYEIIRLIMSRKDKWKSKNIRHQLFVTIGNLIIIILGLSILRKLVTLTAH